MNVIYSLSNLSDWVEIARNMQKKEGWNPILWVSTDALIPQITKIFPQCKIQEYMAGNRGEFTHFSLDKSFKALDETKIQSHLKSEKIVLKMMDRMDPTQKNFTYNERIRLYYDLLSYWSFIFDNHHVDHVLFNEFPHSPFDYILYVIAKERGIKVLRFAPTHIQSRILLAGTLEEIPYYLKSKPQEVNLSKDIMEYIQRLEGSYNKAVPFYMRKVMDQSFSFKRVYSLVKQGWHYLYAPPSTPLKAKKTFVSNLKLPGIYLGYYRILGNLYKKSLRKEYISLANNVDLTKNYIYIPLHYQPEKTTSPEGGFFVDQYLMVAMISKVLPKGWKVYVKEHISQFSTKLYGERGRSKAFYHQLRSLGNVEFVPLKYQSFELIDKAKAVATVTGTAALEAVNREHYALIFGYAWFNSCEGMVQIRKEEDILKVLKKLEEGSKPSKEKIKEFFALIDQHSVKGYTAAGANKQVSGVTREENIENMTIVLQKYFAKMA